MTVGVIAGRCVGWLVGWLEGHTTPDNILSHKDILNLSPVSSVFLDGDHLIYFITTTLQRRTSVCSNAVNVGLCRSVLKTHDAVLTLHKTQ